MNEVSALSPFPARYTSINFTTSQSGEYGTWDEKGKMKEERRSDADVCGDALCVLVCPAERCFLPASLSFSVAAPSFLLWLFGQEVARGYNILSDFIIVTL